MFGAIRRIFQKREIEPCIPGCDISKSATVVDSVFETAIKIHDRVVVRNSNIGRHSYITTGSKLCNVSLGKYCSIGQNVQIGLPTHPSRVFVSTHPAFFSNQNEGCFACYADSKIFDDDPKSTHIGSDVWIGNNAIVFGGLEIGHGAIIGAGSVVTKDVPAYAIVAGNPARIIRYRFSEDLIEKLLHIEWWEWSEQEIKDKKEYFSDIETFLKMSLMAYSAPP